ncbi:hypothetical protein [Arthrobacter sp. AL12]|uniref:hypothetical protein n=1 Tax=Arthrobacter sp. AL12 TaxID=3042241 RepID=UPI00249A4D61|nr:hypothetical protein [Arthrobacter sp. AL12]MDI3213069.1 hypothetical protein [Arthrobacter sp. AL12]
MSEKHDEPAQDRGPHQHSHAVPTTQQIRTVGQRRRQAEEKLEHHLEEARHKNEHHSNSAFRISESETAAEETVGGGDSAATHQDDG